MDFNSPKGILCFYWGRITGNQSNTLFFFTESLGTLE